MDSVVGTPSENTVDTRRMVGRCEMFEEIACGGMATVASERLGINHMIPNR